MKTILITACLYIFINFSTTQAQTSYLMSLSNASQPNLNTFEFDVYVKGTSSNFVLNSYQCAFTFNADNSNVIFSYIPSTSELSNIPFYAIGKSDKDGISKLTFASSAGKDTIKSTNKRIGRFRLTNGLGFTNSSFIINWNFAGSVSTLLTGSSFNNITNSAYHTNLSFTANTQNPKSSLAVYPLSSEDDGFLTNLNVSTNINNEFSYMGDINRGFNNPMIRFPNAGKVAGNIIDSAFVYLTAYADSKSSAVVNIRIAANDTVNAQPISTNRSKEFRRILTTAQVDWNCIPVWQDGKEYKSPDLKSILQEWANIPNHNAGDAVLLLFNNNGSQKEGLREFSQWDYTPKGGVQGQEKPRLVIYYHTEIPKLADENEIDNLPEEYQLFQNYPNPFNPTTTIQYQIIQDGFVTLKVYDMLGSEIATLVNEQKSTGIYNVSFDASNQASGTYIYAVKVNDFISTKKMILLK